MMENKFDVPVSDVTVFSQKSNCIQSIREKETLKDFLIETFCLTYFLSFEESNIVFKYFFFAFLFLIIKWLCYKKRKKHT
jgi:hypothetical protein